MISVDAVVIGSGFGGSVCALRLAERGVKVHVLERGAWWQHDGTGDRKPKAWQLRGDPQGPPYTPRDISVDTPCFGVRAAWRTLESPLPGLPRVFSKRRPGLLERVESRTRGKDRMDVVAGAAVGGGSQVFGGMMVRPTPELWSTIGLDAHVSFAEISPFYDVVQQVMGFSHPSSALTPAQWQELLETKAYRSHAAFLKDVTDLIGPDVLIPVPNTVDWAALYARWKRGERLEIMDANYLLGSPDGLERTLDRTYLAQAMAQPVSAKVFALQEVTSITRDVGTGLWRVESRAVDEHAELVGAPEVRLTPRLFVCAGSAGTCRLLVRARDAEGVALPAEIGTRWGSNGDQQLRRDSLMADLPARQGGPPTTGYRVRVTVDGESVPVTVVHTPGPDLLVRSHIMLGMAPVKPVGRWRLRDGEVRLEWDADAAGTPRASKAVRAAVRLLAARHGNVYNPGISGGEPQTSTYHPLGGCVLGHASDKWGRVNGAPGLYVIDGAMIPGHTGTGNPSWTIAALAERCIQHIVATDFPPPP